MRSERKKIFNLRQLTELAEKSTVGIEMQFHLMKALIWKILDFIKVLHAK